MILNNIFFSFLVILLFHFYSFQKIWQDFGPLQISEMKATAKVKKSVSMSSTSIANSIFLNHGNLYLKVQMKHVKHHACDKFLMEQVLWNYQLMKELCTRHGQDWNLCSLCSAQLSRVEKKLFSILYRFTSCTIPVWFFLLKVEMGAITGVEQL